MQLVCVGSRAHIADRRRDGNWLASRRPESGARRRDLELTALEDVGGVDDDLIDGESSPCTGVLSPVRTWFSLVAMGDADGDVAGLQARIPPRPGW